jgi:hypothetical protein
LAGASALLEGAFVLAAQPVRSKAVPLTEAEQFEPGTLVVVVGTVVVVVVALVVVVVVVVVVVGTVVVVVGTVVVVPAAEAGELVGATKPAIIASIATNAVPAATCRECRPWR